jgi:glutamate racemase
VEQSARRRVGVLATAATLESEKYRALRARFEDRAAIVEHAAPSLVELVESAPKIGPAEMRAVGAELRPFLEARVDALVLGCTHFPFLTEVIQAIMGPEVELFESGVPVAREVERRLGDRQNPGPGRGSLEYFSSDPARARVTFELLLGRPVELGTID